MGIAIKTCIAIYCNTDGRIMILFPIYWDRVKEFTLQLNIHNDIKQLNRTNCLLHLANNVTNIQDTM